MRMADWENRLQGMKLWVKLGGKIYINNGELVIQFRETKGRQKILLCFAGDKEKYKIDRREPGDVRPE
jgi:hypothetical protein